MHTTFAPPRGVDDEELTTAEACALLGRHPSWLSRRAATNDGISPSRKLPGLRGAYLFRRSDVERLAAELAVAAANREAAESVRDVA